MSGVSNLVKTAFGGSTSPAVTVVQSSASSTDTETEKVATMPTESRSDAVAAQRAALSRRGRRATIASGGNASSYDSYSSAKTGRA